MRRLPAPVRMVGRRTIRLALRYARQYVRQQAGRVPFSRLWWLLPTAFWGEETIHWRGVTIMVNPGEVHGFYPYFLGSYSEDEIDLLIRLCAEAEVLTDVGANIGLTTLAVGAACPNLHIDSFEPDPTISARLRANLRLNELVQQRVDVIEKAAADASEKLTFSSVAGSTNAGTGHLTSAMEAGVIAVDAVRLDSFYDGSSALPQIVKIDVEGAELRVLRGLSGLFDSSPPRHVLVEVHGFTLPEGQRPEFNQQVHDILKNAGYALYQLDGSAVPPVSQWPGRIHIHARRREDRA